MSSTAACRRFGISIRDCLAWAAACAVLAVLGALPTALQPHGAAIAVSGVALAAAVARGVAAAPCVGLGTLVGSVLGGAAVSTAVTGALGVTGGGLLAAVFLRRRYVRPGLDRVADVRAVCLAGACIFAPLAAGVTLVAQLLSGAGAPAAPVAGALNAWCLLSAAGVTVAAVLLTLGAGPLNRRAFSHLAAAGVAALTVAAITGLCFETLVRYPELAMLLAAVPPLALIAAAVRYGPAGAALAAFAGALTIAALTLGDAAFRARGATDDALVLAAAYVGVCAVAAQWLAADLAERRREHDGLRALAVGSIGVTGEELFRGLTGQLARVLEVDCVLLLGALPSRPQELLVLASSDPARVALGDGFPAASLPLAPAGLAAAAAPVVERPRGAPAALPGRDGLAVAASLRIDSPAGELLGALLLLHPRPLSDPRLTATLLGISGPRIAAEIERQRSDQRLRDYATALEAINASYADARAAAEAAAAAKGAFVATVSHELRTPLTAILGFAETLEDGGASTAERLSAARTIRRNGEHLLALINDVLDFSKLEAGGMTVEPQPCALLELIADVTDLLRISAEARGLTFAVEFDGALPDRICTDPVRLRQILFNLVGNALKFTRRGGVRVTVGLRRGPEAQLAIDVRDTGIGLAADNADSIFAPFAQADRSISRLYGGTGLGLAVSRQLARLLGGDVVLVESTPGSGSCFRATLAVGPLDEARLIDAPQRAFRTRSRRADGGPCSTRDQLAGCRVLLAEDGPDNQRLFSTFLARAGAIVRVVVNGREAVDVALGSVHRQRAGDPPAAFDVILMDMQMPEMDGYEATRTLRRRGYSRPIIALTAHAVDGDRQACLDAGCDGYATKPISRAQLVALVAGFKAPQSTIGGARARG